MNLASFGADSIQVVIAQDTLFYPAVSQLDFPAYRIFSDSSQSPADPRSGRSQVNENSEISAKGSISRGIQVSSNASVSLQSSLYLKISGDLGNNYAVDGVLTERTSPLQPIGNTRRLNDFDRVLVTIKGPALTASIGDLNLQKDHGKFGRFQRSIEGIDGVVRSGNARADASIGFSYGQYTAQQIQGREGKQGPYRLQGKNGEKFIIILAGSEKIDLDGQRLERGDYVIDYNAAEISFSPAYMISSNTRIAVEFEYVPDVYLANYSFGKQLLSVGASVGDQRSTPFYFSASIKQLSDDGSNPLGSVEQSYLQTIFEDLSDTLESTWVSTVVPDDLAGEYVYDNGILVYVDSVLGTHRAQFNFVGLGIGEYRKELDSGVEYFVYDPTAGEYLPAQKLIAPRSQSMVTFSTAYKNSLLQASGDFGVSRNIHNLYATGAKGVDKFAWDGSLGISGKHGELMLGQKYYEQGFTSFEILESNEYYRQWKLSPRIDEQEQVEYATFRVGAKPSLHASGDASQLSRSDQRIGQQARVHISNDVNQALHLDHNSLITQTNGDISQQHSIKTALRRGKYYTQIHGNLEDGLASTYFENNDHVGSGITVQYTPSKKHQIDASYDLRRDFRQRSMQASLLDPGVIDDWTDQRRDIATKYSFKHTESGHAIIAFKYRQHENDTSGTSRYTLGDLDLSMRAFDEKIKYSGHYTLDEEHIPKYDFQYVLVDTGYGDYSYDPITKDYLPVNGGRFIRQRVFSDREEQVRKIEGKTSLEYSSEHYNERERGGFKVTTQANNQQRTQVHTGDVIQSQAMLRARLTYRLGEGPLLQELYYQGRNTQRFSALYNFGDEDTRSTIHEVYGVLLWNPSHQTKVGGLSENRNREIEYNLLATEDWVAFRPYTTHTYTISDKQQLKGEIKYSLVDDKQLDQTYSETYVKLGHRFRVGRRASIDQQFYLSQIEAMTTGIPYSIFSGRQPGKNWKYTFTGRYVFSNRFQISLNYSIQERGETAVEQFMRLEGRTHF
ncbi:MAG: hypothetical protein K9N38_05190 [Candidatus Marinimicrobia bacterium]|nr:hypothetical protein [Candidatus Neomarinimicrobiota bacterium]